MQKTKQQHCEQKICSRCSKEKPIDDFYTHKTAIRQSMCKSCNSEYMKEWYKKQKSERDKYIL